MDRSRIRVARAVGAGTVLLAAVAGCGSSAPPAAKTSTTHDVDTSSSAAPAQPADYTALLIKDTDIVAPEVFTARPPTHSANGRPGVAGSFSNPDASHVIVDTIAVLPDQTAAAAALTDAKADLPKTVTGTPEPAAVGTGGTTVTGNSPDGSKSVAVLLFTEGKALVTLQFDGPLNATPPADFITDLGQKQAAAIKNGLPG